MFTYIEINERPSKQREEKREKEHTGRVCVYGHFFSVLKKNRKKEEKPAKPKNGGGSGSDEPPGLAVSRREESKAGLSDENGQGEVGF